MNVQERSGRAVLLTLKRLSARPSLAQAVYAFMLLIACGTQLAHAERKTTYFHTDGLGSIVAASDENGALLWRKEYAPYGDQLDSTAENEKLAYTGKEHDDVTGLTYFGARYYDPQLGRFLSVDPAGVNPTKPFSFNRYAYANNNPFKFVDPDGREAVGAAWLQQTDAFFGAMPAPRNKLEAGLALAGIALPFAAAGGVFAVDATIAALANPGTALAVTETVLAGDALGGASLAVGTASVAALARAKELQALLSPRTQRAVTTAIAETVEGMRVVGSSEGVLRPIQRAALQSGEVAAKGARGAHAEVNAVNGAKAQGLTPLSVSPSRPACVSCQQTMKAQDIQVIDR